MGLALQVEQLAEREAARMWLMRKMKRARLWMRLTRNALKKLDASVHCSRC